nr:MAG TPA: hypothetical protein [Caudoviricetes sp.]
MISTHLYILNKSRINSFINQSFLIFAQNIIHIKIF